MQRNRLFPSLSSVAVALLLASGCPSGGPGEPDGGEPTADAGIVADAGPQDAGPDAQDAGPPADAGVPEDAGPPVGEDAGPPQCAGVMCPAECVFYADVDVQDPGDGATPADAFATVQEAIDAAFEEAGDCCTCDVHVAAGTYFIYSQSARDTVRLRSGVNVYGGFPPGFAGERDIDTHVTRLDGRSPGVTAPPPSDAGPGDAGQGDGGTPDGGPPLVGGPLDNVFHVVTGADDARLDGFEVAGGWASEDEHSFNPHNYGGGLYAAYASPTVVDCTFKNNHAVHGGGAYFDDSTAVLERVQFIGNSAERSGGGLDVRHSVLTPLDLTIAGNAAFDGGGLHARNSTLTVETVGFTSNIAENAGGGAHVEEAQLKLTDAEFVGNNAGALGGGLSALDTTVEVLDSSFQSDNAVQKAGALHQEGGELTVTRTTFRDASSNFGGAVYVVASEARFDDVTFEDNTALPSPDGWFSEGGALSAQLADVVLNGCTFARNSSMSGGAIAGFDGSLQVTDTFVIDNAAVEGESMGSAGIQSTGVLLIERSVFERNVTASSTGAVHSGGPTTILASVFRDNESTWSGVGGVSIYSLEPAQIRDSLFDGNVGGYPAGALYSRSDNLTVAGCTFFGNGTTDDIADAAVIETNCNAETYIHNSIIWDSTSAAGAPVVYTENGFDCNYGSYVDGATEIYNSIIEGGCTPIAGVLTCGVVLDQDPLFVDVAAEPPDLRLLCDPPGGACSPAVDSGHDGDATRPTDLDQNPRIQDGDGDGTSTVDMGAYERSAP